jgi:predicted RNA-binding Zn ribbon-like protein
MIHAMTPNSETDRPAPGRLALVQAFLNAPTEEPGDEGLRLGEAAIATRLGVTQQLVSAGIRGRRLVGPPDTTLATPRSAANWLKLHGFGNGEPLGEERHAALIELRESLLALALQNVEGPAPAEAMERLNRIAEQSPVHVRFGTHGPSLSPVQPGADGFAAEILARVYEAHLDGTWERLKACPADRCLHVFYDVSRNRTATWCSMAICGNRAKVRSYQQRRRSKHSS